MGDGERDGKRASFNGTAAGNSGVGRDGSPNRLERSLYGDRTEAIEVNRPYLI
jgi:hypothetical protein